MNINLEVEVKKQEASTVLVLSGEIDAYTAPKLKESLLPLTRQPNAEVVVDLEHVNYMDSTGLGVFISALKSTNECGSKLRLIHLQDRVHRLFKITSLDNIITIDTTVRGGN
ncbi:STAS domain-containing protein [Amphibacillus sediminis]|uniref:STAS domain-containing protein n=1 Tax=Amphibacillus sediminis TaxID=360185 RepID=UPI00082C491D|nr:STAS domain-containing protein [Amphibacillus sediminis]